MDKFWIIWTGVHHPLGGSTSPGWMVCDFACSQLYQMKQWTTLVSNQINTNLTTNKGSHLANDGASFNYNFSVKSSENLESSFTEWNMRICFYMNSLNDDLRVNEKLFWVAFKAPLTCVTPFFLDQQIQPYQCLVAIWNFIRVLPI